MYVCVYIYIHFQPYIYPDRTMHTNAGAYTCISVQKEVFFVHFQ